MTLITKQQIRFLIYIYIDNLLSILKKIKDFNIVFLNNI